MAEKETQIGRAKMKQAPQKPISFKLKDKSVKTKHLDDKSVTEVKLDDNSVSTRTIINESITEPKMHDNSVSTRTLQENSVTHEKIHDNAVKARNINDKEIGWKKLNDDLKNIISTSAGQHGIPLSTEFGDSNILGITQKTLSEAIGDVHKEGEAYIPLQMQIDQIVNDKATVSLSVTPSPVFVGEQAIINLVAVTDTQATSIKIKKDTTEIATGSGFSLTGSDTFTPTAAGNTAYTAEFTIAGLQKQTTKNVVAVYPIKYGAGDDYTDATTQASVRTTPAGTYNVTVPNNGDYVFFVVPRTMNINSAKMSGFDFPLQAPQNVEIEGVEYKYYQSANTYDAGTLTIVIS